MEIHIEQTELILLCRVKYYAHCHGGITEGLKKQVSESWEAESKKKDLMSYNLYANGQNICIISSDEELF